MDKLEKVADKSPTIISFIQVIEHLFDSILGVSFENCIGQSILKQKCLVKLKIKSSGRNMKRNC